MASVHLGRLLGPVGFARTVAIKRLHAQFARDPEFVSMFLDEARLAARIRHPNVVSVLDVVALDGELFLVMDYVEGESLSTLLRVLRQRGEKAPPNVVSAVLIGTLMGLHAAHQARGDRGMPLEIVHRDVSPQNILVGTDGVARVVDFGIAKASGRAYQTRDGQLKGKVRYMAPEQVLGSTVDRRTDVYAACIVLWQALVGRRPYADDESDAALIYKVLEGKIEPPTRLAPWLPAGVDQIIARGLSTRPEDRYATALDAADAIAAVIPPATTREVGAWVEAVADAPLRERDMLLSHVERTSGEVEPSAPRSAPRALPPREDAPTRVEVGRPGSSSSRRRATGGALVAFALFASGATAFAVTRGSPSLRSEGATRVESAAASRPSPAPAVVELPDDESAPAAAPAIASASASASAVPRGSADVARVAPRAFPAPKRKVNEYGF